MSILKNGLKFTNGSIQNAGELLTLSSAIGWTHYALDDWEKLTDLASQVRMCHDENNNILGVGLCTTYASPDTSDEFQCSKPIASIGMMLTHPDARGKGVGGTIFKDLLAGSLESGAIPALVATEMGRPIYEKQGFVATPQPHVTRLSGSLENVAVELRKIKQEKTNVIVQSPNSIERAVQTATSLDTPIFGADRSSLMTTLLTQPQARLFIATRDGNDVGYLISTRNTTTSSLMLGPFVSENDDIARALVQTAVESEINAAAGNEASLSNIATFLTDNTVGAKMRPWLEKQGFEAGGSVVHMIHGESEGLGVPGHREKYISIASPAWA